MRHCIDVDMTWLRCLAAGTVRFDRPIHMCFHGLFVILLEILTICSITGLSFGSKDYTKELKTVECTSFL